MLPLGVPFMFFRKPRHLDLFCLFPPSLFFFYYYNDGYERKAGTIIFSGEINRHRELKTVTAPENPEHLGALVVTDITHLHSALHQVQFERQSLPHEDVRVMGVVEGLLQLLQLR